MLNIDERELRWKYFGGYPVAILCAVFTLGGAALFLWAGFELVRELRYQRSGVDAAARVIDKGTRTSTDKHGVHVHHWVRYAFADPSGHGFEGEGEVKRAAWDQHAVGGPIEIRYLRDDPSENRLRGEGRWSVVLMASLMGLLFLGILVFVGRMHWRQATRAMELIRDGRPVMGEAGKIVKRRRGKRVAYYLEYQFAVGGASRKGQVELSSGALRRRWASSGPILVMVDIENPDRHRADVFEARAVDGRTTRV